MEQQSDWTEPMTSDVAPTWTAVSLPASPDVPFAGLAEAVSPSVVATGGCVRSDSGQVALIVPIRSLLEADGLEVSLHESGEQTETLALLVTDQQEPQLVAELRSLTSVGDLVAVPYALSSGLPADFARRGHLEQLIDTDQPATFVVFERTEDSSGLLEADAPVGQSEGPDNLRGREDWFRGRQSSRDDSGSPSRRPNSHGGGCRLS